MTEWISFEKQKPPYDIPLLIFVNRYVMMHVNTWTSANCWADKDLEGFITHWMLLPAPPKEEE